MKNIPKILHLYWSEDPMSWLQTRTIPTFHKQNPDWEIRVYRFIQKSIDNAQYIPDYTGVDYFPLVLELPYVQFILVDLKDYGIKEHIPSILRSDILRYHLLYDVGGIWSDFDVLWLKPILDLGNTEIIGESFEDMGVSTCQYNNMNGFHYIGILIAKPKHIFYKLLIAECDKIQKEIGKDYLSHQMFGSDVFNILFPDIRWTRYKCKDAIGIPYKSFYPYPTWELERLYKQVDLSLIKESTIALHWFNGHVLSKEYVNAEDQYEQDCTMTHILINNGMLGKDRMGYGK